MVPTGAPLVIFDGRVGVGKCHDVLSFAWTLYFNSLKFSLALPISSHYFFSMFNRHACVQR